MAKQALIVGPDKISLSVIQSAARESDIIITTVEDGTTALQRLKEVPGFYNLVISNDETTSISGLQLLNEMRTNSNLGSIPFILVSKSSNRDSAVAAIQAGVNDYLVKPFSTDRLKNSLKRVLNI